MGKHPLRRVSAKSGQKSKRPDEVYRTIVGYWQRTADYFSDKRDSSNEETEQCQFAAMTMIPFKLGK
jgi:hypothetical protein